MTCPAGDFVAELRARSRGAARVRLPALWEALPAVQGHSAGEDRRQALRSLIERAVSSGQATLPGRSAKGWDRAAVPALPPYMTLGIPAPPPRRRDAGPYPWSPRLAFLQSDRPVAGVAGWMAADRWLKARGRDAAPVPTRERSWEVFGDEKAFDAFMRRRPFRDGALDGHALFRMFDVPEPLEAARCPPAFGRPVLVAENTAAFHSLSSWNARARAWSCVYYGRGNSFSTAWRALPALCASHGTSRVDYAGDIDAEGIGIPGNRAADIAAAGLDFRPCGWLYRGMLAAAGRASPEVPEWSPGPCGRWLPPDLLAAAEGLGRAGRRVAQEAFGTDALALRHPRAPDPT